jgi:nitrite reductase (NADH) small subunit
MPFVPVARIEQIPVGKGLLVERERRAVAIFNAGGGRFHATSPLCPHEDGPLADGWVEGTAAVCPWHGFDFDLVSGQCVVDPGLAVTIYAVRVSDGVLEVDLP